MWSKKRWVQSIAFGAVAWTLLALVGGLFAARTSAAVLPTIVTWDEWAAAAVLLPICIGVAIGMFQRNPESPRRGWSGLVTGAAVTALVIFGLDLLTRAIFGLGWKPFQ